MTNRDHLVDAMRRLRPGAAWTAVAGAIVMDDGSPPPSEAEIAVALASPEVAPVPASVTRFQARAALLAAGLLDDVEATIAGADRFVQIAWADAASFERTSPTIAALAAALGLTDQQLGDLFRAAATISA